MSRASAARVFCILAGMTVTGAAGAWLVHGGNPAGLLAMTGAVVGLILAVAGTVHGDRRASRGDAPRAAAVLAKFSEPDETPERAPIAVTASGEAERLADTGGTVVGLAAAVSVVAVAAAAVLALWPARTATGPQVECIHTRTGDVAVRVYPGDPAGELVPTGDGC